MINTELTASNLHCVAFMSLIMKGMRKPLKVVKASNITAERVKNADIGEEYPFYFIF